MANRTIIVETDDFAYRVTYGGTLGKRYASGFFYDMEVEIYDVEIGKSKTTDKWLVVDRDFIGSTLLAYLDEQCQEDLVGYGPHD